jgi:hypothetical protein
VHGLIFRSFREFTQDAHPSLERAIWDGEPEYSATEAYPDDAFFALLARAAELTGRPPRALEVAFGEFTARTAFLRLQPAFYRESGSTRQFLLDVEARMHRLVRATINHAAPPRLHVAPLGAGVSISYTSDRRLCGLLEGLVRGTAAHYGEAVAITQVLCVRRGDMACVFHVVPAGDEPA